MFLNELLGAPKRQTEPYFDAFFALAMRLSRSLSLSEWATGIPQTYTLRESVAIDLVKAARHRLEYTTGSRFVEEALQKLISEIGLTNAARELRTEAEDEWGASIPIEDLGEIVSAYLKAWLCNSNPFVLLELAELLAQVGRSVEASEAIKVALKFPAYARTMTLSDMELAAQALAYELFPPGLSRDARSLSQGLNSAKALTLLNEEASRVQAELDKRKAGSRELEL